MSIKQGKSLANGLSLAIQTTVSPNISRAFWAGTLLVPVLLDQSLNRESWIAFAQKVAESRARKMTRTLGGAAIIKVLLAVGLIMIQVMLAAGAVMIKNSKITVTIRRLAMPPGELTTRAAKTT